MRLQARTVLGSHPNLTLPYRTPPQCPFRIQTHARFQSSSAGSPFVPSEPSSEHTPRRRRRFKKAPKSQRLPLDVKSLGKPGEIVVVPPKPARNLKQKLREVQNTTTEDAQPVTLTSMLEDLEEEYTPLTSDVIRERIESHREPAGVTGKLTASEWEAVRDHLTSAFTYNQLSEYIEDYDHSNDHGREIHARRTNNGWRPGTSAFLQAYPDQATQITKRVTSSHDLKGKALLAERILRDCWTLSIVEEIGQIDLRLSPSHVTLLLQAEHFSFDEIATLHESSIDVTSSLGLVRITGRQESCESMAEIIHDAIARIREDDIPIDPTSFRTAMNHSLSQRMLEFISTTYGVAFATNDSQVPEKIIYLAENREGAENARRAFDLILREATQPVVPFSTYFSASDTANTYIHNPEDSVSWLNQQKQWFRWAMPSTQSTESQGHSTDLFDNHQTRLSDHLLKRLRQASAPTAASSGGLTVHESVTASVGHCLFSRRQSWENAPLNPVQLGKLSLPRTFSTDIPRVINYLTSLRPITPAVGTQIHKLQLTPSSQDAHVAPTLEVTVLSKLGTTLGSAEDAFEVQNVRAILRSNDIDYLLPENGLDLRFTHKLYHELSSEELICNPDLQDLFNGIKSSLRGTFGFPLHGSQPDEATTLPTFCHLALPAHMVKSRESVTAEYMFSPIHNIRRAAVQLYELDDRQLSYSYHETGPILPARVVDVSLSMEIPDAKSDAGATEDQMKVSLESEFHSFYKTACRMAFDIHRLKLTGTEDGIFEPSPMFR
ncbi:hypothetical protein POX_b03431 [Penicillium oxalicum]|uniref:hypothetical protein n=1 Tax=Penicillium oxalicum TaxID=69781 RepID=UPI0020B71954|nr:hypothetical protein POX_b03431 [Penicillium oxalicum]KAI2793376.1 hypothetical protein POX_b03431 [Penicillium oxalicum]